MFSLSEGGPHLFDSFYELSVEATTKRDNCDALAADEVGNP